MSSSKEHHVLVIGAGIAGCSAAYQLQKHCSKSFRPLKISIVDDRPCGSLTSSASTECFRNWWTEPTMLNFVGHSIDLYEEMDSQVFEMKRTGYFFLTSQPDAIQRYTDEAHLCERLGAGDARLHPTQGLKYENHHKKGIDVLVASPDLSLALPFLPEMRTNFVCAKHVRNCGWISVQRYLDYINFESTKNGVSFLSKTVSSIDLPIDTSLPITVAFSDGSQLVVDQVVFAVGPKLKKWILPSPTPSSSGNLLLGKALPSNFKIILEIHAKVVIRDVDKVIPRDAPLMLFDDPVTLNWSAEQVEYIRSQPHLEYLLQPFKGGVHFRPFGSADELLGIWTYNLDVAPEDLQNILDEPVIDEYYGEIVLRGLSHFVPKLERYLSTSNNPLSSSNPYIKSVKAGYYCKTPENRPFIGPAWQDDARVSILGALSGFGIMSAPAAAELITAHTINQINGEETMSLPSYYREFLPQRYEDEAYLEKVRQLAGNSGQL